MFLDLDGQDINRRHQRYANGPYLILFGGAGECRGCVRHMQMTKVGDHYQGPLRLGGLRLSITNDGLVIPSPHGSIWEQLTPIPPDIAGRYAADYVANVAHWAFENYGDLTRRISNVEEARRVRV